MQLFVLGIWSLVGLAIAHPGHDIQQEIQARARGLEDSPRDISHCAAELKARGLEQRTVERRTEILRGAREKRGLLTNPLSIKARDTPSVLQTNHSSPVSYDPETPLSTIFAGNKSCILMPEVTEGPYYVSGELIRSDLREPATQKGIDLIIDIQVIDVSTCKPLSEVMVDIWAANATGVYSGIVNPGNGNGDPGNKETTFGRGLQMTNEDGVANFTTIYPGHYTGRTQHIHVATHLNGVIFADNNTFQGATVAHIGQIFFDQSLSDSIENDSVYQANQQPVTTNAQDGVFLQEAAIGDPVVEYSLLSDSVQDGVFAWISFGIDVTKSEEIFAAAAHH
ncbi:hypothetical protein LSUE1_G000617 [Lachnellula suecica]|uniref:Intradiol ring-cleavage dioxygenases domain-containing protein n=1 Tax=Lachnellula suecica TaxID=602035 RepID=A0A8T9CPE8_9HELO|nr:hypothetical protein LSUE1_G000617 [Lachnellula suecica]